MSISGSFVLHYPYRIPRPVGQGRHLDLPSSRATPLSTCPGLRPRWKPEYSPYRIQVCCLPRHATRRLSSADSGFIPLTTTIHFSGLNTGPVSSLHPAPDSRYRACLWISLPACRLRFNRVGLSQLILLSARASPARRLIA